MQCNISIKSTIEIIFYIDKSDICEPLQPINLLRLVWRREKLNLKKVRKKKIRLHFILASIIQTSTYEKAKRWRYFQFIATVQARFRTLGNRGTDKYEVVSPQASPLQILADAFWQSIFLADNQVSFVFIYSETFCLWSYNWVKKIDIVEEMIFWSRRYMY